jgi:spermidine/putrescine transport system substrate-binding protein
MNRVRLLSLLVLLIATLAACGSPATTPAAEGPTAAETEPTDVPTSAAETAATESAAAEPAAGSAAVDRSRLDTELFFYNWGDYIDEEILEDFKNEFGVTVNLDTYDTNEDMLAKIRPGNSGYDVIVPSDYAVDILIKEGLVAKLDKANIPNIGNLDPSYMNLYYDPGNEYSVPYFVGVTGIAYNKTVITTPPDTWAALFDPARLEPYKGKVSMLDDERESIGAALIYLGTSINDTDPANLAKAEELLQAQKPLLAAYNSSDFNRKLAAEEVVIAHAWNGSAGQAYTGLDDFPGNPDIGFVVPKEGGAIWQDNLMIVGDTSRKYTAEVFINYLLDAEVGAKNTDYILYGTPNVEAAKLIAPETKAVFDAGFGPPGSELIERLQWIKRSEGNNTIFSDVWTRIKSS